MKEEKESPHRFSARVAAGAGNGSTNLLKDMSSSELTMIHRLSGNDPVVRNKTMRKLSKWLMAVTKRVPDEPESKAIIEPNMIRVWKALFYCMWMSDKPLVQEQLAEQISNLLNIFAPKPHIMSIFIEWFVLTMAREWSWIDRLRMDKYMMLVRRFLRKVLTEISERGWKADTLSTLMDVIARRVLNRDESPNSKRKSKGNDRSFIIKAPLGFQIHFIDIFMEELAKIGGNVLKAPKVLKLITPFIQELSLNDDDRILDELKERIFHQLMKQSDVGIDYQESKGGKYVFIEDENSMEDLDENDLKEEVSSGPLDPRAGAVDVILPQLKIDYEALANKLIEFGGQKGVKLKNRKILYNLARQFKEITEGKYPLTIPREDSRQPAVPRKELRKATNRLLELEISDSTATGKRRKTKKERRREALRGDMDSSMSNDSLGSEDNSSFLHDDELLEHVSDNYMSYLEDEIHNKDAAEEDEEADSSVNSEKSGKKVPLKKKKKGKEMLSLSLNDGDDAMEIDSSNETTPVTNRRSLDAGFEMKRRKTRSSESNVNGDMLRKIKKTTPMKMKTKMQAVAKKSPKIFSTPQNDNFSNPLSPTRRSQNLTADKSTFVELIKKKMTPKKLMLSSDMSSPNSAAKKKVCFILAKNLEHEHADYKSSIERSPAIPYSSDKRPSFGLLKSSPRTSFTSTTPRRKAAEFF